MLRIIRVSPASSTQTGQAWEKYGSRASGQVWGIPSDSLDLRRSVRLVGERESFTGRPYSFAVHDNFGDVNFGAGMHVWLAGRAMPEVGITSHKILGVQQSDIPSLGTATLLNLQTGLGYTLK